MNDSKYPIVARCLDCGATSQFGFDKIVHAFSCVFRSKKK